jgi:hypothetical protein
MYLLLWKLAEKEVVCNRLAYAKAAEITASVSSHLLI